MTIGVLGIDHFEGSDNAGVAATVPAGTVLAVLAAGRGSSTSIASASLDGDAFTIDHTRSTTNASAGIATRENPTSGTLIWSNTSEVVMYWLGNVDLTGGYEVDFETAIGNPNDGISVGAHTEAGGIAIWAMGCEAGGSQPSQSGGMTIPFSDLGDVLNTVSGQMGSGYIAPTDGSMETEGWSTTGTDRQWAAVVMSFRSAPFTGGARWIFFSGLDRIFDEAKKRLTLTQPRWQPKNGVLQPANLGLAT